MKIINAELRYVCGVTSDLPDTNLPQIAFVGRSNVGKSSLINRLLGRKSLARTSSVPGKTQTLNFYEVNKKFFLVDLPGYGYTKAPESVKKKWAAMIGRYLRGAGQLRAVFQLVDIRREPTDEDKLMRERIIKSGFKSVVIAAKSDKLKRSAVYPALDTIRRAFDMPDEEMPISFSALSGEGRDEVLSRVEDFLRV